MVAVEIGRDMSKAINASIGPNYSVAPPAKNGKIVMQGACIQLGFTFTNKRGLTGLRNFQNPEGGKAMNDKQFAIANKRLPVFPQRHPDRHVEIENMIFREFDYAVE
ncbi:MAG: hypothetical protein BM559_12820 [Roseobacter sp. MedPE-SWchi]|nr:MAG: hypothetical protein BM559_12820 [Roseobacter sp. MedPE-SWchi]